MSRPIVAGRGRAPIGELPMFEQSHAPCHDLFCSPVPARFFVRIQRDFRVFPMPRNYLIFLGTGFPVGAFRIGGIF